MRFHAARFLVLLLVLPLVNCSWIFDPDDVDFRIRNGSGYDFESVLVGFPNEAAEYGAVRAGEELLEHGRYTYELRVRTDPWEVWLDFVKE